MREAVVALEESLKIYQLLGNEAGQANAANNLGCARCSLRLFEPGTANLRAALEYFENSGQDRQAARTRAFLSDAEKAMGA